jgi:hypothetical protein
MNNSDILPVLSLVLIIALLWCYTCKSKDGFSLSTKPFEADWTLLNRNPFDDVTYQTPSFYIN